MSAQPGLFDHPVPMRTIATPVVRPIPGHPDYFVSDQGRVFSAKRDGWRELIPSTAGDYNSVSLCNGGVIVTLNVHRAVASAFIGPAIKGSVVRHLDGDARNNAASNLAYGSYADNEADKDRHGRRLRGTQVPSAKLTDAAVVALRSDFANGTFLQDIAARHGLSDDSAFSAIHGETWSHLPVPDYSGRPRLRPDGEFNQGERHAMAKLTEDTAAQAIRMLAASIHPDEIAAKFKVSRSAIGHIAAGRTWRHLPRPERPIAGLAIDRRRSSECETAGMVKRDPKRKCAITGRTAEPWSAR